MAHFSVLLKGTGCRVIVEERRWGPLHRPEEKVWGFFTTRFVDAECAEKASRKAIAMVQEELKRIVKNRSDEPWELTVEEVTEGVEAQVQPGLAWFPEDAT